jgi:hypothetical protein
MCAFCLLQQVRTVYIYTQVSDPEIRAQLITMCTKRSKTTSDKTGGRLISATGSKTDEIFRLLRRT